MKFGQLVEYNVRNVFLYKLCKKWSKESSSFLLFFYKALYKVDTTGDHLGFDIFW